MIRESIKVHFHTDEYATQTLDDESMSFGWLPISLPTTPLAFGLATQPYGAPNTTCVLIRISDPVRKAHVVAWHRPYRGARFAPTLRVCDGKEFIRAELNSTKFCVSAFLREENKYDCVRVHV
jgi:hypothetical protein